MKSIFLVEDNPADVILARRALKSVDMPADIVVARDGAEAITRLREIAQNPDERLPSLILLDLNMPLKDGRQTLTEIKSDASLCEIPVVMLTTSDAEPDVSFAYANHASGYIVKPSRYDEYISVASALKSYWAMTVKLPRK